MNKDRIQGKAKDIAGRIERQAGEWTDDPKKQVEGAAKQAEGKVQNAWGKAKDAVGKESGDNPNSKPPRRSESDEDAEEESRETGS